jgi:hypothetical protein
VLGEQVEGHVVGTADVDGLVLRGRADVEEPDLGVARQDFGKLCRPNDGGKGEGLCHAIASRVVD